MLIFVQYYSFSDEWKLEHAALVKLLFFGMAFIALGANMVLMCFSKECLIQKEISKIHGVFIFILGVVYTLHYSGIMTTTNNKIFIMVSSIIGIFVVVLRSAMIYGLFKRDSTNEKG